LKCRIKTARNGAPTQYKGRADVEKSHMTDLQMNIDKISNSF